MAWLIVGAGFTGCTLAERIATQLGQKVMLIDRRPHIGGNAYDCLNDQGILVHRYGPHIFHTHSPKVWDYLSDFTDWRPYEHRVLAVIDGNHVPVPFNLESLHRCFPKDHALALEARLLEQYGADAQVTILRLRESPDAAIRKLADYIYDKLFYGYTVKQWELTPEQLDPLVTGRVPVRVSRDDRYFTDEYQAMPARGYSELFQRMVDHPLIEVQVNTDYHSVRWNDSIIFTGPIDEYFKYRFGPLPYRSLRFEFKTLDCEWSQPVGTVNYPNGTPYTRITEQKHLTGQRHPHTTVIAEYPEKHLPNVNEPYYPIPREQNRHLYGLYLAEAQKRAGKILFAGRLADYKYYNMDQAVARALKLFQEIGE